MTKRTAQQIHSLTPAVSYYVHLDRYLRKECVICVKDVDHALLCENSAPQPLLETMKYTVPLTKAIRCHEA